jgi:hypothetical protein
MRRKYQLDATTPLVVVMLVAAMVVSLMAVVPRVAALLFLFGAWGQ